MKKFNLIYLAGALLLTLALGFSSCTKEGPAGAAGKDGADGTDGTPGVDANSFCINCHSAAKMDAIATEFAMTKHVMGSSWARGTSESCGRCHSHDGFVEFARSGEEIAAAVSTAVECGTCHGDHASLEEDLTAPMREVGPVVAVVDETITFEHGMGNLCATCHQARTTGSAYDKYTDPQTFTREFTGEDIAHYTTCAWGPAGSPTLNGTGDTLTVVFDVPTTHVYVSSTHAGPHHGPQANTFAGITGYPENGLVFDRDHHTDCAACHLGNEAVGYGHSFSPDIEACNECHGDAVDLEGMQADFHARIDVVVEKLVELHLLGFADGAEAPYTVDDVHPMYSSTPRAQFQAFYSTMCILEDKSFGPHNPDYIEQMLSLAETNLGL
ncbi:MAG: hypothetical protein K9H58_12365 [Bacteroidales bacterium]|nr:hypothetical protein [Bacteroidales bacterium]